MKTISNIISWTVVLLLGALSSMCNSSDSPNEQETSDSDLDASAGTDTNVDTDTSDSTHSLGCGLDLDRPDPAVQQTIDIEGTTRYYLLNVPEGMDNDTPHPLIFALHGFDMNNVAITGLYNFKMRSKNQAIVVYPQGDGPPPGDEPHWGDRVLESKWTADETNYTFIQTLKDEIKNKYCIDPGRVFLTGFSMGGMFTNSLACAHNDWFRAYAPVEGGGPGTCDDETAKPAVIIHQGTADTIVGPEMGEASRDFWAERNGCEETTTSTFNGCETYDGCAEGRPVTYCVGDWDHTIDSVAVSNIWQFFDSLE